MAAPAPRPSESASWTGWWASGLKDAALTDEQLAARDLSRADPELQKRFGKGTRYDLKVVLRGDIGTGKSALLKRLRGGGFSTAYEPSAQIATAKIAWKCAAEPDDVISIDVWDVVDRARKAVVETEAQLSLEHRAKAKGGDGRPADGKHELLPLDASLLDVYAGAHAVIFLVDPSKQWTVDYVTRELAKCPEHLPVAVCVNFRDYGPDRRSVSAASLDSVLCAEPFTSRTFRPQALETSMANCYGLHALHAFLTVPFLAHKRSVLQRCLESNTAAMGAAHKALAQVRSATYEEFVATLEATARAEAMAADLARMAAEEQAARAATAEAERWRWLTGDPPPAAPVPGGGVGAAAAPRPVATPVVQPGAGVFAIVPPGALPPGRMPVGAGAAPAAPAAADSSTVGTMLSYLGGLGATLGSASSYLGTLVGSAPPPKTAVARLDDFLGAPQPGQPQPPPPGSAAAMGEFLAGAGSDAPRSAGAGAAPPARRSRVQHHAGIKSQDWDEDSSSDDDGGGGGAARARAAPAIPSMRPTGPSGKPLVLGQPPTPGSSGGSTPQSAGGGGSLRVGPFGPPPGAHAAAPAAAPRESRGHRTSRSGGGSPPPRRSAVELGGAKGTRTDGRPREWDESSDED